MKIIILIAYLVLCLPLQSWVEIISKEGGFTISFPEKPETKKVKTPTKVGELITHAYICDRENLRFTASYAEINIPTSISDKVTNNDIPKYYNNVLNGVIKRANNNNDFQVIYVKHTNYDKFPAVEIKMKLKNGSNFINKFITANNKVYTIGIINKTSELNDDEIVNMFFSSFKLLN